jgi:DNA-binding MarR family transcriptional regulator
MVTASRPGRGAAGAAALPGGLAECVARLRRAMRRGSRIADPGNQLTTAELELLSALSEAPGAGPDQLAGALQMRPGAVSVTIGRLREMGMIGGAPGAGHTAELVLTAAGRWRVQAWRATDAAVLYLALSGLSEREQRALTAAVPALYALASAIDQLGGEPEPAPGQGAT